MPLKGSNLLGILCPLPLFLRPLDGVHRPDAGINDADTALNIIAAATAYLIVSMALGGLLASDPSGL